MNGKEVLCLASGGGKQSAAFAMLGAKVTVLDLSAEMLKRDRLVAEHYGFTINIQQSDMRDLSMFSDQMFDLVFQPYSINFIPNPEAVFDGVRRILRVGGRYCLQFHNPFVQGVDDRAWDGKGYPLNQAYINGEEMRAEDWEFEDPQGIQVKMVGPKMFRHTLGSMVHLLAQRDLILFDLWEDTGWEGEFEPGTWEHYMQVAAPWLTLWLTLRPGILA